LPEREVKLGAAASFRLPSLEGIGEGLSTEAREPERLSTVYLDTDDLRLVRWGMSLRFRAGEGWTVKLPLEEDGELLVRGEHVFAGNPRRVPGEAVDLISAFVRGAELLPQVRLRTVRRRVEVRNGGGALLADVVDDEVAVLDGRRIATRFRELEIEIADETPAELLQALLERLREAGAGEADPTPKVVRALGDRASDPPEVVVEDLGDRASAADVVRLAIASSVVRLIRHDPVVRLDTDPEGVHQARVATRRLRSDLRTFRSLLDPEWASALRKELGWLADILGRVRDGDVMLERMRERAGLLPERTPRDAVPVLATLERDRDAAHAELLETLRGERYLALLDRLVEAAGTPALAGDDPDASALDLVPGLVRRPWRSLARSVKGLPDSPSDEELHAVRIRAKRFRYAAEAAAPVVGKDARKLARAAAGLQEVLGDLNDAVVSEAWLREWTRATTSTRRAFAAGELAGLDRAAALEARARWPKAWKRLSSPKLRSWL
jgi:CHAD domain-containing protein